MDAVQALLSRPEPPPGAISRRQLERYVAGDLPRDERAAVEAAMAEVADAVAALRADDAAFEQAHPWERVSGELFARAERLGTPDAAALLAEWGGPERTRSPVRGAFWRIATRWLVLAGPAVAALIAVALVLPQPGSVGPNRIKGGGLTAMLWVDGTPAPLVAGEALSEGDRLQLTLTTTHSHLALLGVDGTGTVSRYAPVGAERSMPFGPGQALPLPDSLVLDGSPGPEVFVAFASDEALLVEDLEQALHDVVSHGGARALLTADLSGQAPQVGLFWVEKTAP